jgi:multidrug efflux pump
VKKRSGSNIINGVEHVRAIIAAEQPNLPEALKINFSRTSPPTSATPSRPDEQCSKLDSPSDDRGHRRDGHALWLSGWLAVPASFLAGILILYLSGETLNMMVLFSLIMASGMLVDGAIVIVEFADRKMTEGLDRKAAYTTAAQRMAMPVIASTVTTLAAFFPILFWPGIMGDFRCICP